MILVTSSFLDRFWLIFDRLFANIFCRGENLAQFCKRSNGIHNSTYKPGKSVCLL